MTDDNLTPSVNPDDLKRVWLMVDDFERNFVRPPKEHDEPGNNTFIGPDIKQACAPGEDVDAVQYRVVYLKLMQEMSKHERTLGLAFMNLPKALQGKPSDAVFKAFAVVRMVKYQEVERKEFPVDLEQLTRLIGESQARPI
jgi:hypothetical protein